MSADLSSTTFWHACRRKDLDSILAHGLQPTSSRSSFVAVYLTDDRFTAENYTNFDPDEDWAMLKIPGSLLQAEHLLADDYEFREMFDALSDEARSGFGLSADSVWSDHGWEASLAVCNQVAYAAAIPVSLDMVEDIQPSKAVVSP